MPSRSTGQLGDLVWQIQDLFTRPQLVMIKFCGFYKMAWIYDSSFIQTAIKVREPRMAYDHYYVRNSFWSSQSGLGPAWFAIYFHSLLIRNRINQWFANDSPTFDFFIRFDFWFDKLNRKSNWLKIPNELCIKVNQKSRIKINRFGPSPALNIRNVAHVIVKKLFLLYYYLYLCPKSLSIDKKKQFNLYRFRSILSME